MSGKEIMMKKVIAIQIKTAIENSSYTITGICQAADVYPQQLYNILDGFGNYQIDTLAKIVEVLEIDMLHLK